MAGSGVKGLPWGLYQGLRCSNVGLTMREGFAPNDGFADFDPEIIPLLERLRRVRERKFPLIAQVTLPTRPMSIDEYERLFARGGETFDAAPPGDVKTYFELSEIGTLEMQSEDPDPEEKAEPGARRVAPLEFRNVMLHPDTARQFAPQAEDGKTTVRVRLTDPRVLWSEGGDCFCRINVPTGPNAYDRTTLDRKGKQRPADLVLGFLFFHLYLPPSLVGLREALKGEPAPQAVVVEHGSPLPEILRLMDFYGLTLFPMPEGHYLVYKRRARRVEPLTTAPIMSDLKNVESPYPPVAIRVRGGKVRRNVLRLAVPVSHDVDGKLYYQQRVMDRYNVPLEYVLSQIPRSGPQAFDRITLPALRKIAQDEWGKLFQVASAVGVSESEIPPLRDLPMLSPSVPKGALEAAFKERRKGDEFLFFDLSTDFMAKFLANGTRRQATEEVAPLVMADSYVQRTRTTAETIAYADDRIKALDRELQLLAAESVEAAKLALAMNVNWDLIPVWEYEKKGFKRLFTVTKQLQTPQAKGGLQGLIANPNDPARKAFWDAFWASFQEVQRQRKSELDGEITRLSSLKKRMVATREVPEDAKIRAWYNLSGRFFPEGTFSVLDAKTGLIRVNDPVGLLKEAPTVNLEQASLQTLPNLRVIYAVEYETGTPADFYSFMAVAVNEKGAPLGHIDVSRPDVKWPDPKDLDEKHRLPIFGSPLPVHVLKEGSIALKVDNAGTEFNGLSCDDIAQRKAIVALSAQPAALEGRVLTYEGWHRILDVEGVSMVQYSLQGGKPVTQVSHLNRYHMAGGVESPAKAETLLSITGLVSVASEVKLR